MRVARAKVAKESERLEFVRRNAEEEARRVRGIEQVQRAEAEQKLRLVGELVRADLRGKDRLRRTASEKVLETVKLAQEREKKLAIAAEAKASEVGLGHLCNSRRVVDKWQAAKVVDK